MEYKCPYSVRGMLISEVWDKIEYLEMHEGKLNLKRGHRDYKLLGIWLCQAWRELILLFGQVKGIHLLNLFILKQSSGSEFFQTL